MIVHWLWKRWGIPIEVTDLASSSWSGRLCCKAVCTRYSRKVFLGSLVYANLRRRQHTTLIDGERVLEDTRELFQNWVPRFHEIFIERDIAEHDVPIVSTLSCAMPYITDDDISFVMRNILSITYMGFFIQRLITDKI